MAREMTCDRCDTPESDSDLSPLTTAEGNLVLLCDACRAAELANIQMRNAMRSKP
jgi:hypothetical protein